MKADLRFNKPLELEDPGPAPRPAPRPMMQRASRSIHQRDFISPAAEPQRDLRGSSMLNFAVHTLSHREFMSAAEEQQAPSAVLAAPVQQRQEIQRQIHDRPFMSASEAQQQQQLPPPQLMLRAAAMSNVGFRPIRDRAFMGVPEQQQQQGAEEGDSPTSVSLRPSMVQRAAQEIHDRPFIGAMPDLVPPPATPEQQQLQRHQVKRPTPDFGVDVDVDKQRHEFFSDQQAILASLQVPSTSPLGSAFEPDDREEYYRRQQEMLAKLPEVASMPLEQPVSKPVARGKRRVMAAERSIRVFFSSTFRDMGEEREILLKKLMPQLRAQAAERGVALSEVDLRWGVTEEQSKSGGTINICLSEVDRCRPFFVCMLGERYGWHQNPSEKRDELLVKTFAIAEPNFPWISKFHDRSITELEIRHGVLNSPKVNPKSLFLLRDPAYVAGRGKDFVEQEPESRAKLLALKDAVRGSGCPVFDYSEPKQAIEMVGDHLRAILDHDFPAAAAPTPLEVERSNHEAFVRSRSRVYVGGEQYIHALMNHLASQEQSAVPAPIVVRGESGSGKSSLVCNFQLRLSEAKPDLFVLSHYIGSTAASTSLGNMLHRVISEIVDYFDLEAKDVPTDVAGLVEALPKFLADASSRGGLVIILDALNQLDQRDNAHELAWLPTALPPRVQLVVSTLTSRPSEVLAARGWKTLRVEPMDEQTRRSLIEQLMERSGKSLSPAQTERLATAQQCSNPLFLRTILEELRVFGSFEQLDKRINECLGAQSVPALLSLVLARIEADTSQEAPGAVRKILGLLCTARRGIRENEAVELLGVPRLVWSSLFFSLSDLLISRAGLLNFSHDFVRQAAHSRFVAAQGEAEFRHMLIEHFAGDARKQPATERVCEELPHHLLAESRFSDLSEFIGSPAPFGILSEPHHRFDLYRYLRACSGAGCPAEPGLVRSLASSTDQALLLKVGKVLEEIASFQHSEAVLKRLLAVVQALPKPDLLAVAEARSSLGYLYRLQARFDDATPHCEEALKLRLALCGENSAVTASSMISLAILYRKRGMYDKAEPLYLRSCEIREKLFGLNHPDTAQSHNGLGCLYQDQSRDKLSEKHFMIALQIRERCLGPNNPEVAMTLTNLATLLLSQSRLDEAEKHCLRALAINESVFGREHHEVAQSLSYLASTYVEQGQYAKARPLYERAIAIKRKLLGNLHPELADSLTDFGVLCARTQRYDEALDLYQQCLKIRQTTLGQHPDTAQAMNNVAAMLMERGQHDEAEAMFKSALEITEKAFGPMHTNVPQSLLKLANLYQRQRRPMTDIQPLYERALNILVTAYGKAHPDVALTLNDFAVLSYRNGLIEQAEKLYLEMVGVMEKVYAGMLHPDLAKAYRNTSAFFKSIHKDADAIDFMRKATELEAKM